MSRLVAMTMRDTYVRERGEARDCLEVAWWPFLRACNLAPICIPNDPTIAVELLDHIDVAGLILTGGGDVWLNDKACARDEVEEISIARMIEIDMPVIGICRGLQKMCAVYGGSLQPITGHVRTSHRIFGPSGERHVNSFHNYQIDRVPDGFEAKAWAEDGSIEWIAHRTRRLAGIMWHPERMETPDASDVQLFVDAFGSMRSL
ncbi:MULTISPECIES: gamma-glutamyl-gamma-aminobutyrate hydrolase family protein [unclassified Bradyrhizobium]|uniref:gamma-glutamyl-gamma-aminobutyrate hydrolase family protein n=1 Tax=unclassified Bradyrhizobium TaxID=2631580 RepID=UPI0028E3DA21|nr:MULTISPECIES: gamma-glutamyl-gamma-aminobutyrate hydrolase family protein [unclassified Bradyrhizobium]